MLVIIQNNWQVICATVVGTVFMWYEYSTYKKLKKYVEDTLKKLSEET